MSWARGTATRPDGTIIEVGYSVRATCDHPDCDTEIDRGLSYRCGYVDWDHECWQFYCGEHMLWAASGAHYGAECFAAVEAQPRLYVVEGDADGD